MEKEDRGEFDEYKFISIDDLKSEGFAKKYRHSLMENGSIVSSQSSIIKNLATKMRKTHKATYLQVQRIFLEKKETKKTATTPTKKVDEESPSDLENNQPDKKRRVSQRKKMKADSSESSDNSENSTAQTKPLGTFTKSFQDESIFQVVQSTRKHRNKIVPTNIVKSGWASRLAMFLFQKLNLNCKFDFKNIWIKNDKTVRTMGKCECQGEIHVTYREGCVFVDAKNMKNDFEHKRRYQIRGEFKAKLLQNLEHASAQSSQMKVTNELISNDTELNTEFNPFLPKSSTIRNVKYRALQKKADPIDVLLEWKYSIFQDDISAIGLSPFFVFYRSKLQLAWYIVESKKHPICITLDATGSVINPPLRSQRKDGSEQLKHVFFYTIMVKTHNKSVPIAQMISQDQTSEFITLFLRKMFKKVRQPAEVVCDESKALLKALAQTFTGFDRIEDYVSACMSAHLIGSQAPLCYFRIDRSHFIKNLTRKVKYRNFHKQKLIRGIFGYLIQCNCFATVKNVVLDFFTLILSEYDGIAQDGVALPSEEAKKRLLSLCSTHDENVDYASHETELEGDDIFEGNDDTPMDLNFTTGWIDDILEKVLECVQVESQSCHENAYFCNEGEKKIFVNLFSTIALWSNIMNPIFKSKNEVATSSDVESYFKSFKVGILERKRLRADEFVRINIEFANSEIKLNAMSHNDITKTPPIRKRSNSLQEKSPNSPGECPGIFFISMNRANFCFQVSARGRNQYTIWMMTAVNCEF